MIWRAEEAMLLIVVTANKRRILPIPEPHRNVARELEGAMEEDTLYTVSASSSLRAE